MSDLTASATPVRRAEARGATPNPTDAAAAVTALRTVLLYSIATPFALVPEEIMWAGYHLDKILAPLKGKTAEIVPLAVRQEMLTGHYSTALEAAEQKQSAAAVFDSSVKQGDLNDWAAVLISTITQCYTLRPMEESAMHGQLVGLLRELGVGDPVNPRGARFLPNDVRHRLATHTAR
jgi:hypothetical protein